MLHLPLKRNDPSMKRGYLLIAISFILLPLRAQEDPFLAGRASMIRGEYSQAAIYLEKALAGEPGDADLMIHLGVCYFRQQEFPRAWELFFGAEKRKKGMGTFYLAKTEVRLNHPELALKYLEEHLSSHYKLPEDEILLDPDLGRLENSPGWQELWNKKQWYSAEDKEFQEARFMKDHGRELEAINVLNKLEKKGYRKGDVLTEKAEIFLSLGNKKAAVSAFSDAANADYRNSRAQLALATSLVEEDEAEEARNLLDRLIRREPDLFDAYLLRARASSNLGQLAPALRDMDTYLEYFPEDHGAYYSRGLILHEHGQYLDAIRSFNRALEMDPGMASYFFARGKTYAATGTIRSAERDMSMALDLDPLNGDIWFHKARISERMGNLDDACFAYRKAYRYGVHQAGEMKERICK